MDYFQGVVTEYLRARRTQFVNTEYMINLDADGIYKKDRHWYCDAVAVDFADATVYLCEITYSKTLNAIAARLQSWCNHWPELVDSVRRDSSLSGEWRVIPRVFVPEALAPLLDRRIKALSRPSSSTSALQMPEPMVTPLEQVLPWMYRSWNGRPFATESLG